MSIWTRVIFLLFLKIRWDLRIGNTFKITQPAQRFNIPCILSQKFIKHIIQQFMYLLHRRLHRVTHIKKMNKMTPCIFHIMAFEEKNMLRQDSPCILGCVKMEYPSSERLFNRKQETFLPESNAPHWCIFLIHYLPEYPWNESVHSDRETAYHHILYKLLTEVIMERSNAFGSNAPVNMQKLLESYLKEHVVRDASDSETAYHQQKP